MPQKQWLAVLGWLFLLWSLPAPVSSSTSSDRSPVRLLISSHGRCSAVVLSRNRALTAAHCLHDDLSVDGTHAAGVQVGPDLARLEGVFAPPYARRGGVVTQALMLEGYGCDPEHIWIFTRARLSVRPAELLQQLPARGLELAIFGRVCGGDSGGAVWNAHGNLVGIITAHAADPAHAEVLAFATLAR